MAASLETVEQVYAVLEQHVPDPVVRTRIMDGLAGVEGNTSFEETVRQLVVVHTRRLQGGS